MPSPNKEAKKKCEKLLKDIKDDKTPQRQEDQ